MNKDLDFELAKLITVVYWYRRSYPTVFKYKWRIYGMDALFYGKVASWDHLHRASGIVSSILGFHMWLIPQCVFPSLFLLLAKLNLLKLYLRRFKASSYEFGSIYQTILKISIQSRGKRKPRERERRKKTSWMKMRQKYNCQDVAFKTLNFPCCLIWLQSNDFYDRIHFESYLVWSR